MNEPNAYWKSLYDEARLSVMIELLGNRVTWQPSYLAHTVVFVGCLL